EHFLGKEEVAGSSPAISSTQKSHCLQGFFHFSKPSKLIDEIRLAVRKTPIGCQIYCQNSIDFFKISSPVPDLPKPP
ncbi:MAG: hypothetical protein U0M04_04685, partial [Christensenellales bacterium]|nr:hypothetical protein [Christensenellales bacterium]